MKMSISLNIQKLVDHYNRYATIFNGELITTDYVLGVLDEAINDDIYTALKPSYAVLRPEELEKFATLIYHNECADLAVSEATQIYFHSKGR